MVHQDGDQKPVVHRGLSERNINIPRITTTNAKNVGSKSKLVKDPFQKMIKPKRIQSAVDELFSSDPTFTNPNLWTKSIDSSDQGASISDVERKFEMEEPIPHLDKKKKKSNTIGYNVFDYDFDRLKFATIPNTLLKEARKEFIQRYKHMFGFYNFEEDSIDNNMGRHVNEIVKDGGEADHIIEHSNFIQTICFVLDLVIELLTLNELASINIETVLHEFFIAESLLHAQHIHDGSVKPSTYVNFLVAVLVAILVPVMAF
eukprot:CAMPEP_0117419842 /NCGR_PEP_ID=MMETSP0758-20121206/1316_1 /TAXON_ID=63605 /ORGANISM="Percolomonas cosmopolitus, Strain AE-1 (ATCC 50343)" /LENGTH=259 /DNA_ID=CAMNT_0005201135 /DNA_START=240 /DNA_END=1020 /DNA_ORIENTATION=+